MADTVGNVVWILGAGFSRSLGGPLLADLFTHERRNRVVARLPSQPAEVAARLSKNFGELTNLYRRIDEKDARSRPPWSDPEEFIEFLNRAAADSEGWSGKMLSSQLMTAMMDQRPHTVQALPKRARQYLAAVCHEFAPDQKEAETAERWFPYRRWGDEVRRHSHAIVTFNYDRVVELVYRNAPALPDPSGLPVTEAAPFLKLHGSVDWTYDGSQVTPNGDVYAAISSDQDFALAIPGPSKVEMSGGLFSPLWTRAEQAIKDADVIIFVGYRFPESDAVAKQRILGAITSGNHRVTVRIVLGARRDEHVERVEGMLKWALANRRLVEQEEAVRFRDRDTSVARIIHEPMKAEDFLTVFEAERLNAFVRG
jgi:hypothetical protein